MKDAVMTDNQYHAQELSWSKGMMASVCKSRTIPSNTVPLQGLAMHGATPLGTSELFEIEYLLTPGLNKIGETEIYLFSFGQGPSSKERLQAIRCQSL